MNQVESADQVGGCEFADVIDLALKGCCGVFAIELSQATNSPIVGFVDEEDNICHFCVSTPDGFADALGLGLTIELVSETYIHVGKLIPTKFWIAQVEEFIQDNPGLGALDPSGYRACVQTLFHSQFWSIWLKFGRNRVEEFQLRSELR